MPFSTTLTADKRRWLCRMPPSAMTAAACICAVLSTTGFLGAAEPNAEPGSKHLEEAEAPQSRSASPSPALPRKPLTAEQQKRLDEARQINKRVHELWKAGNYEEALPLAEQALEIRQGILGDDHADTVTSLFNLGAQHYGLRDYAQAEAVWQQTYAVYHKLLGQEHEHTQMVEASLARLRKAREAGLQSQEDPLAGAAINPTEETDVHKTTLTPQEQKQLEEAIQLNERVCQLFEAGKYCQAIPLAEEALRVRRQILGADHPDTALSLFNLAAQYHELAEYAKAEPLYLEARDIRKRALGEDHPDYAKSLLGLAGLYRSMGEFAKAEPLYLQALDIHKRALGEDHPSYAMSLNSLASLYRSTGQYAKAEPLYLAARDILKTALGEDHPHYAMSLLSLAGLYRLMGEYTKAEPLYLQARDITKKTLGEDHPHHANSLHNLAVLYYLLGDYGKAELLYLEDLNLTKKTLGKAHPHYAASLNSLAARYLSIGEYTKAEPLYLQARDITKKTLGEDHPDYANILNHLAGLHSSIGEYTKAEPLHLEARDIRKKALGEAHPDYANSVNNLALLYASLGDYAKAEPLYLEARDIKKKALGEDHPDYANSVLGLAVVYRSLGDYAKAEPLYLEACDIYKKTLGEAHPNYAASLNHLAGLYVSLGDYAKAEPLHRDALNCKLSCVHHVLPWLHEAGALSLLRKLHPCPQNLLACLLALSGDHAADAYGAVWQTRAVVTRMLAQRRRQIADSPATESLWAELQSTQQQLAQLTLATVQPEQRAARQERLRELNEQKERLEGELAKVSQEFRRQGEISEATPETLAQVFPEGVALVEFLAPCISQTGERAGKRRSVGNYQAFVLRRSAQPPGYTVAWVQLGPAQPIEAALDEWRAVIMGKGPSPATDEDPTAPEARLRAAVWDPIEPHLAGYSQVYLVPDGPLSFLPWAALPGREPGGCLLDDYAVATVGYGQQLYELLTASKSPSDQVLLAGGVAYDESPAAPPPSPGTMLASTDRGAASGGSVPSMERRMTWNYLPGSRAEVDNIVALRTAPPAPRVLTGSEASEAALRHWMPQSRYIHLATHGFFADERFRSATQHHVEGEHLFGHDMEPMDHRPAHGAHVTARNPLILSGLVLAGANLPPKTDSLGLPTGEDGILTAEEIVGLDLRGTELVVLSACDTGLGNVAGGEGVMGLQRAFHLAGARNVIASLWKVDDHATAVLMRLFYENLWQQRMPPQAALRDAQLTLYHNPDLLKTSPEALRAGRLDRPVPLPDGAARVPQAAKTPVRHWAAFVLSGAGR